MGHTQSTELRLSATAELLQRLSCDTPAVGPAPGLRLGAQAFLRAAIFSPFRKKSFPMETCLAHMKRTPAMIADDVSSTAAASTTPPSGLASAIEFSTADWRWAAHKGFWNPQNRCWNEELGGINAYLQQKNQRRNSHQVKRTYRKLHETDQSTLRRFDTKKPRTDTGNKSSQVLLPHSRNRPKKKQIGDTVSEESENVERPLAQSAACCTAQSAQSGNSNALLSFMLRHRCAHLIIRRYWTVGYQPAPIIALFQSLPRRLRSAIGEALDAARRCPAAAATDLGDDAAGALAAGAGAEADAEWEGDGAHGFVRAEFDPATQAPARVAVNARAAALLGMSRGELLARYARRDAPLALPPLDALRAFLHGLRAARAAGATRYYRVVPPPPPDGRPAAPAALVCAVSARVFARSGVVVEVSGGRRGAEGRGGRCGWRRRGKRGGGFGTKGRLY
jgi:hypothetical protein